MLHPPIVHIGAYSLRYVHLLNGVNALYPRWPCADRERPTP